MHIHTPIFNNEAWVHNLSAARFRISSVRIHCAEPSATVAFSYPDHPNSFNMISLQSGRPFAQARRTKILVQMCASACHFFAEVF